LCWQIIAIFDSRAFFGVSARNAIFGEAVVLVLGKGTTVMQGFEATEKLYHNSLVVQVKGNLLFFVIG